MSPSNLPGALRVIGNNPPKDGDHCVRCGSMLRINGGCPSCASRKSLPPIPKSGATRQAKFKEQQRKAGRRRLGV